MPWIEVEAEVEQLFCPASVVVVDVDGGGGGGRGGGGGGGGRAGDEL